MATDAQTLLSEAKCYICLGITMGEALQLALLAQIASGGGGGGGGGSIQLISTIAADPNAVGIVPADPTKAAEFYQDPSITLFNRWSWSVVGQTWFQTISP